MHVAGPDERAVAGAAGPGAAQEVDDVLPALLLLALVEGAGVRLQVEVAGGGGPDILDLDGPTDVAEFAKADRVLKLDDYAEKYGWKDMFYDWAYDSCIYNGALYSLPTSFEGMVMYYNMDVMAENGWEVPATKEELVELMPKMQERCV